LEGFHKVPLLRDRLFLQEVQDIRDEIANRCPTPEGDFADDDPDRPAWPAHSETSESDPPYTSRVARPAPLRREASSSHLIATNLHSTPSTQPLPPRFNSAISVFVRHRPVYNPRKALIRLPASSLRSVPVFDNRALQNLLLDNDFLRTVSQTEIEEIALEKLNKPSSLNFDENLSFKPRENLVAGLYPNLPAATHNEATEAFFRYEKAPKIFPTFTVGKSYKSPSKNKKRASKQPLRAAASPHSALPTTSTVQEVVNPNSKNRRKRAQSLSEEISAEADMSDVEEYLNDSLDDTHLSDNEEGGEFDTTEGDEEDILQTDGTNMDAASPIVTEGDIIPTSTVGQTSIDIQNLGTVIKQSLSGRNNHQKKLVILDTYDITHKQALDESVR
jgi:hypothetical protein